MCLGATVLAPLAAAAVERVPTAHNVATNVATDRFLIRFISCWSSHLRPARDIRNIDVVAHRAMRFHRPEASCT